MRFYLDENLSPEIAVIARRLGGDITSWRERNQIGTTDDEQLWFATIEDRCIVTQNCWDFKRLTRSAREAGLRHAGVLCVRESFPVWDFEAVALALKLFDTEHPEGLEPYAVERLKRRA